MNDFIEMTGPRFYDPALVAKFAVPEFLAPLADRINAVDGLRVAYPYPENWGSRWELPVYVRLDGTGAAALAALLESEHRYQSAWCGYGTLKITMGGSHCIGVPGHVLTHAQFTISGSVADEVATFLDHLVLPGDSPSDEVSDQC